MKTVIFRIDEDLHERLKAVALKDHRGVSGYLRIMIHERVAQKELEEKTGIVI